MLDILNNKYQFGIVKWFGGYNYTKEKENDFGFIQSMDEKDVFLHKSSIKTGEYLDANEVIIFQCDIKNGKPIATNAYNINTDDKISVDVLQLYLIHKKNNYNFFKLAAFEQKFIELLNKNIKEESIDFIEVLIKASCHDLHVYEIIKNTKYWTNAFRAITNNKPVSELLGSGVTLELFPPEYINDNEGILYKYIENLSETDRCIFFETNIERIPFNTILASVIRKKLISEDIISNYNSTISTIIEDKFRGKNIELPEFVNKAFSETFKEKSDYISHKIIWKISEPLLLKKYIYNKNYEKITALFNSSLHLKGEIEYFILANLLPLILANNNLDVTYNVFLGKLWSSLVAEDIVIHDQGLFKLFPSCTTMNKQNTIKLSCEAVYWPKADKYLCRGEICSNPKITPNIGKHYLDFNIYDWLKHYGIDYIAEEKPSKKDFPIKIAGYFNRLKEIFSILHCRKCGKLLKSDMRYARVEYIDYESGEPVKKSMSAAYRATVFECGEINCQEHEKKYYINHCMGFDCGNIIDSRDLKVKCDTGRYICNDCGDCCQIHAKDNPVGLCPNCGSKLNLFEDLTKTDKYGKKYRNVQCSNQHCNFEITKNLPNKFYLPSCLPVGKIKNRNYFKWI